MTSTPFDKQRRNLLDQEVLRLNRWLGAFDGAHAPAAGLGRTGETLWVKHFPLPDGYRLDDIHLLLMVRDYPTEPPKGLYLLSDHRTREIVQRLRGTFNVFQDRAYHGAPAMDGFEWICVGYLDGWRYDIHNPAKGDNVQKMLLEFWRLMENKQ
jgi:hypothetical protein